MAESDDFFGGDAFDALGDDIAAAISEEMSAALSDPEKLAALKAAGGPGSAATAAGSDAVSANPPKAPAAASGTGNPGIRITDMTSKTPSHTVQTQVQHLNGMLYVWVGGSGSMEGGLAAPSQPNMLVAHPPRTYAGTASSTSAASVLFGAETLPAAAEGAARKLATWAGEPLFLTWALPLSAADEQAGVADDVVLVVKKAIQQGRQA